MGKNKINKKELEKEIQEQERTIRYLRGEIKKLEEKILKMEGMLEEARRNTTPYFPPNPYPCLPWYPTVPYYPDSTSSSSYEN